MNAPRAEWAPPPNFLDVLQLSSKFFDADDCDNLNELGVLSDEFWISFAQTWLSSFGLAVPTLQSRGLAMQSVHRFEKIRRLAREAPYALRREERAVFSPLICSLPNRHDYYCIFTVDGNIVLENVIQFEVEQDSNELGVRWSSIGDDILGQFTRLTDRVMKVFTLTVVGFERGLCFEDDLFGRFPPLLLCHMWDEFPCLAAINKREGLEYWHFDTKDFPEPAGVEAEIVTRGGGRGREMVGLIITAAPVEQDWYAYRSLSTTGYF